MDPLTAAARFGVHASSAERASQANLSSVYNIDGNYILRTRKNRSTLKDDLARERALLEVLVKYVEVKIPILLTTIEGSLFVVDGDRVWTLYRRISGETLCNWTELYKMTDEQWVVVFSFLREMHEKTRGKVPTTAYSYAREIRRGMEISRVPLTPKAYQRIEKSLFRLEDIERMQKYARRFIHGDFHPGNILFVGEKINALIDTDWCRASIHFEDIAYLVVMMLRDYRRDTFGSVDTDLLEKAISWYGIGQSDRPDLIEYILATAAHEMYVFSHYFPDHPHHLEFQRQMVEKITAVL